MVVAGLVLAALTTFLVTSQLRDDSPGPTTSPTPTESPPATATTTVSPSGEPSDTATPAPSSSATPTPSETATAPVETDFRAGLLWELVGVLAIVTVAGVWLIARRRRRPLRSGALRVPGREPGDTVGAPEVPRASLGTPDVLVLTEAASEEDVRLRERVRDREQAIFANLQLACSFYPTESWVFSSARLTVVLAREDGRAAPAPIAYSLRPLSDRDGTAREQSVEIGADMKFVSMKGGEKSTVPGEEFVRGYGLQESVSYWEFTATPHQPLQGSFLLWLIARAPTESGLRVTSTLQVRVAPRRIWSRHADGPSVAGTGEVSLLLDLEHGPPYRARLVGSSSDTDSAPWLVDTA